MKKKFKSMGGQEEIQHFDQGTKVFGTYNKAILPPSEIPALQEKFFEIEINILQTKLEILVMRQLLGEAVFRS